MLDALLIDLGTVCSQLLPILGALALLFLCILLKHLWKLIDGLAVTVQNLDPAVKLVDQSLEKVQAPLDTVVRLSHSVDDMHEKTVEGVHKAAVYATENVEKVKDFVNEKMAKGPVVVPEDAAAEVPAVSEPTE